MSENERAHLVTASLTLTYAVAALVLVAVYREPLTVLARDVARWNARQWTPRAVTVRHLGGKLWNDVNSAIDHYHGVIDAP